MFIGGKSLGGRTAAELISRGEEGEGMVAAGLVELGYPLHRPGHKETLFTEPLRKIGVPSLFLIGEKDPFCDPELLRPLLEQLLHPGSWWWCRAGTIRCTGRGAARPPRRATAGADEFAEVAAEVAKFILRVAGRS